MILMRLTISTTFNIKSKFKSPDSTYGVSSSKIRLTSCTISITSIIESLFKSPSDAFPIHSISHASKAEKKKSESSAISHP